MKDRDPLEDAMLGGCTAAAASESEWQLKFLRKSTPSIPSRSLIALLLQSQFLPTSSRIIISAV